MFGLCRRARAWSCRFPMIAGVFPNRPGRLRFIQVPHQTGGDRGSAPMAKRRKQYEARIYLGRDASGKQRFDYIGRFDRKRDRDEAVRKARADREARAVRASHPPLRRIRGSLSGRVRGTPQGLLSRRCQYGSEALPRGFRHRSLDISRTELKDWMNGEGIWAHRPPVPRGYRPAIVALYNHAIDEDDVPLARSPARGLGHRSRSTRSQLAPPTEGEFERLLERLLGVGRVRPSHAGTNAVRCLSADAAERAVCAEGIAYRLPANAH